ncbi:hypothetical protein DU490_05285 [Halomonas sp. DQ26W]|uniref:hypothetical protein n=1 Tax=Halomonas sp. DQ26W TaxID=2282311 RepID=UPI000DF82866|nr:hypothetical protein [Halomonas sp. DQ26W]RDB43826.1 hypothetical protein DU490_05285 [Halomonas sp. DQ26W]
MGQIFKIPGLIIYWVAGIWGFFLSMGIVVDNLGFIGGTIAFIFFPFTLMFAPLYEGIANSNWNVFIITYGGAISATALVFIGSLIDGDS